MNIQSKQTTIFILFVIVVLALILRVYRLGEVPSSISWDEAAVGYNAYTIANWGKDEYGKIFPLIFRSFGEDKQPIHIYITAIFVKLFGLSEFSTRLPAAAFGSLNVLLIFFLARVLFKSNLVGLFSSLFLSLSPQNIFFSRFNHEANFALFFFMLGLLLFYKMLNKHKKFLPLSFLSFLISIISYHAAEIAVPPVIALLSFLYFKKIYSNKASTITILLLLGGFTLLGIFNPRLLGTARYHETAQGKDDIEKTEVFKSTHNYFLGRMDLALNQYMWHFGSKFLFETGDQNPRLSSQGAGEFYIIDGVFLIIGFIYLLYKKSKAGFMVFCWALVGVLPSSLFAEAPHAGRAAFMMGSWQIIAALGFYALINFFKQDIFKWTIGLICLTMITILSVNYLNHYFNEFPKRYAIDWQYGMKQIVEYVKVHNEYDQVFTTSVRSQPYIFFLFYLATPLPDYLNTVIYNNSQNKSSNNVAYFGKYSFGAWDSLVSESYRGVLYVLSPGEYDGLKRRADFDIKKVVYYPNGTDAFFLVTLK